PADRTRAGPGYSPAGQWQRRTGRARPRAARAHRLLPAAASGGRTAVPARYRDGQHARHRTRRTGHHVLERAALAIGGRPQTPWAGSTGRVSSRIQFRYVAEPVTMGSAMISG